MALNLIETAPKNEEEFIILQDGSACVYEVARWSVEKSNWIREHGDPIQITPTYWMPLPNTSSLPSSSDSFRGREEKRLRRAHHLYAGLFVIMGAAILYVPSFRGNFAESDTSPRNAVRTNDGVGKSSPIRVSVALEPGSQSLLDSSDIGTTARRDMMPTGVKPLEQIIERGSQNSDILSSDIAAARTEIEDLKVRTAAEAATRIDPAQALEGEREHGDALARDLESAREQVEVLTALVAASTAMRAESEQKNLQAVQASVTDQNQAVERERQRGDALARDLESAREQVEVLMALVAATTAMRAETEQNLQAVQASVTEREQALEGEREHGDALARDLGSAREQVEALKARLDAAVTARVEAAQATRAAHGSSRKPSPQASSPSITGAANFSSGSVGRAADRQPAAKTKPLVQRGDRGTARPPGANAAIEGRTRTAAPPFRAIEEPIAGWVKSDPLRRAAPRYGHEGVPGSEQRQKLRRPPKNGQAAFSEGTVEPKQ